MSDLGEQQVHALLKELEQSGCKKVKVAATDIDGILRGKYLHIDKFKSVLSRGFGFCNVVFGWDSSDECYGTSTYTGWHTGYPDALVKLDINSFRRVPWEDGVPFFLGEFYQADGITPLNLCPRQILKSVLNKAKNMGYSLLSGCEFEWFNFLETPESLEAKNFTNPTPLTPGMFGYSILRPGLHQEYFHELIDLNREFKVPIEGIHTETGPGVYEVALQVSPALEAADRAVLFKSSAKAIAQRHKIMASFMAKWNAKLPGCSGHIHLSLSDGNKNLFYSEHDPHSMSPLFKNFLAGLLRYTPEFLPLMAPTVNSYKRLVKGFWAPTAATWGIDNRTCAFRVIPWGASSTRIEVRVPGADMNPYLALAAAIGAGLLGIEDQLPLTQAAVIGSGYENLEATPFPANLQEASHRFYLSEAAHKLFGKEFVNHYHESRTWEWEQSQRVVTDWELKRYFEII